MPRGAAVGYNMAMPVQRALVVDADPVTTALVDQTLRAMGWDVVTEPDPAAAQARLTMLAPALVVATLPAGAGLCAAARIAPRDGLRVLATSDLDRREEARAAGAHGFLRRPYGPVALREAVERLFADAPARPARLETGGRAGALRLSTPGREREDATATTWEALLIDAFSRGFTGVLEVGGTRMFFDRGRPAAARGGGATELGALLVELGIADPAEVDRAAEDARRTGRMLGELLLATGMIDASGLERALREQVVRRALAVGDAVDGGARWHLLPAEVIGLAGHGVHPAAVLFRADPDAPADLSAHDPEQFFAPAEPDELADVTALADPHGQHAAARALVLGGATLAELLRAGGRGAARLADVLLRLKVAELRTEPPSAARRAAALATLEVHAAAARVRALALATSNATHYTVLGLRADAGPSAIATEADARLRELRDLPAALDPASARRVARVRERVREAARVLGDRERRAVYDAWIARDAGAAPTVPLEDHAVLLAERARDRFRRGEYVLAAALLALAAQLEGKDADILAMLGWSRHRACPEDPTAGEAELRAAVTLDPSNEGALTWLARVLLARGDRAGARRLLTDALAANHEYAPAREALREVDE